MASEYAFLDEWDVDAPREAVFEALADAATYPQWWKPVYIAVETDGPPEVGRVSHHEFKGQLPYHLRRGRRSFAMSRRRSSRSRWSATSAAAGCGR